MKRLSLSRKMMVCTVLFFIATVPSLTYLSLHYFKEHFKEVITNQQFLLVSRIANGLDAKIDLSKNMLLSVSRLITPEILNDPGRAAHFLTNHTGLRTVFDNGIYLLTPTGRLIAQSAAKTPSNGTDLSAIDSVRNTIGTKKPAASAPYFPAPPDRQPAVLFTVPILDRRGNLAAILAGSINLLAPNFLGDLAAAKVGRSGYFYLTTTDRTVIVMPDRSRILTTVPPGANTLYDHAVDGYEGSDDTVTSGGIHTLAAFKRLRGMPWILASSYPVDEAYAPVRDAEHTAWIILVLGGMITVLIFWRVMRHLTAPLISVTSQINAIGSGHEQFPHVQSSSRDEIGDLADAFNGMMNQLKTKEEALRKSTELFQLMADYSTSWVFWMTPAGEMLYASPACEQITGYTPKEVAADPSIMQRLVHPDDLHLWQEHLTCNSDPLGASCSRGIEIRIVTKGGETRWLRHTCRPLFNPEGGFIGVRGSNSDITAMKQAQLQIVTMNQELEHRVVERTAQLEEANQLLAAEVVARTEAQESVTLLNSDLNRRATALETANRELESFSYSVSHDLRGPLRHISSFSSFLLDEYDTRLDEQGQKYLHRLCDASKRMAELIDDLLNLSRVVRSDMQFQQKDISGLAREVAGELVETDPGRSVRVDIQDGLSVYADPTLLRIVVQNLMENAWKYTARVETAVIQFGANEQQGETVFFVRDNGIGFDMKYAGKLFVVFQRLHSLDEYEGTGIGLATVQRIVHRHGGRIWAEGKEGEGAVFYFTLGSTGEVGSQQWTAIDSRATYN